MSVGVAAMDFSPKFKTLIDAIQKPDSYRMDEPSEQPVEEAPKAAPKFQAVRQELKRDYPSLDELKTPFGKHKLDPFLRAISEIESSGGANTEHQVLDSGLHEGDKAIGSYGLMPNTVNQIVKNYNNNQSALRYKLGNEYKDPDMEALAGMDKKQLAEHVANNPELETRLARYLAMTIGQRMKDDPERMAYGWHYGSSYRNKDVADDQLKDNYYVNRFRKYKDLYSSDPRFISEDSSLASTGTSED